MKRKKRILIGSLTLVFLLLAVSFVSLWMYGDKYTINTRRHEEACRTITVGCTRAYVEECVRVPPGDYSTTGYFWQPDGKVISGTDIYAFDGYILAVGYAKNTDIVNIAKVYKSEPTSKKRTSMIPWW